MNSIDITLLTTWDDEIIQYEISFENWLKEKDRAKKNGQDGILLSKINRFLKFSNIKDERGRKNYLSLPEPEREKRKELTQEEREKRDKFIAEMMEKTKGERMQKFIKDREKILDDLARDEEKWGMETTKSKLKKLDNLIKNDAKLHIQTENGDKGKI